MKIIYSGQGEKDRSYIFQKLKMECEQKQLPQGCPDWVIYKVGEPHIMIEIKWSRGDFIGSYEKHHLHEQIMYGKTHSVHMALGIVETPWRSGVIDDRLELEKKYRGMLAAVWADYGIPIIIAKYDLDLANQIKVYIDKCLQNKRMITFEHQLPPVYKGGNNEKILMCVPGVGEDTAVKIIEKYKSIYGVINAILSYSVEIDGIGPKTTFAMIDFFKSIGLIGTDDIWHMPVSYMIDRLHITGDDKKKLLSCGNIKLCEAKSIDGYLWDRINLFVEQGR